VREGPVTAFSRDHHPAKKASSLTFSTVKWKIAFSAAALARCPFDPSVGIDMVAKLLKKHFIV
jgi:hypothetical protein